jgi:hypothetical protein
MPAEPESPDAKSLDWEVVVEEPPRRNPPHPTTLTIRKFLRICRLVEKGFATSRARQVECISYSRFRFCVKGCDHGVHEFYNSGTAAIRAWHYISEIHSAAADFAYDCRARARVCL